MYLISVLPEFGILAKTANVAHLTISRPLQTSGHTQCYAKTYNYNCNLFKNLGERQT